MSATTTTPAKEKAPRKPRGRKVQDASALVNGLAAGAVKLLGEAVMWNLSSNRARVNQYSQIKQALADAGLDDSVLKERSVSSACTRAVNDLEGKGQKRERVIDVLSRDAKNNRVVFQFSTKEVSDDVEDGGKEVAWTKEVRVVLDTSSGKVSCKNSEIQEKAQALIDKHLAVWTTSDVSGIVDRLFAAHADLIPLANGVYFVPHQHAAFTAKVKEFFRSLGREILPLPVPAGIHDTDRLVQMATVEYLDGMIKQLDDAVESWTTTTRDDTMETKAAEIGTLRLKIDSLSEYMQEKADQAKAVLDAVNARLLAKIECVKEEKKNLPPGEGGPSRGEQALALLTCEPKTMQQIQQELGGKHITTGTVYRYFRELEAEGRIIKDDRGFRLPA